MDRTAEWRWRPREREKGNEFLRELGGIEEETVIVENDYRCRCEQHEETTGAIDP